MVTYLKINNNNLYIYAVFFMILIWRKEGKNVLSFELPFGRINWPSKHQNTTKIGWCMVPKNKTTTKQENLKKEKKKQHPFSEMLISVCVW